jgi:hypothetical protein
MLALRLRAYERAAVEAVCDWGEHDADTATLHLSQHYAVFPGIADETAAADYNAHSPFPGTPNYNVDSGVAGVGVGVGVGAGLGGSEAGSPLSSETLQRALGDAQGGLEDILRADGWPVPRYPRGIAAAMATIHVCVACRLRLNRTGAGPSS